MLSRMKIKRADHEGAIQLDTQTIAESMQMLATWGRCADVRLPGVR